MKQLVRQFINRRGYDIVRFDPTKVGNNPIDDIRRFLQNDHPIVFDVGANTGQTVETFRTGFPKCTIHCFEPNSTTFRTLEQNVANLSDVHLWNFALGSSSGPRIFQENSFSDMSSFLPLGRLGWGTITKTSSVEVKTVDQFCFDEGIDRIDVLKSDTQGFDLEVMRGAEDTIRASKLGLIYLELIFSDMYEDLPSFVEVLDFLESREFRLVSFYRFHYQELLASWTDALFVSKSALSLR